MAAINEIRAGVLMVGGKDWLGGVNYIRHLIKAVKGLPPLKRPRLTLLLGSANLDPEDIQLYEDVLPLADDIFYVGPQEEGSEPDFGDRIRVFGSYEQAVEHLDFIYPLPMAIVPSLPVIPWIPDFQHKYLPHFFKRQEAKRRDVVFEDISRLAKLVVFSSASAEADFRRFYPDSAAVTHVLRFCTPTSDSWYVGDPGAMIEKYSLPETFLLCCNQFWAHKDHLTLFRALAKLKRQGVEMHCVFTGQTSDSRVGAEEYFNDLMRARRDLGIEGQTHILGVIDRHDQIQLVRLCQALAQPSLFEGWSSVVEDAKSFAKPIFLTDLPVHLEQAPEEGVFYKAGDPGDLATKLLEYAPKLGRTWGGEAERRARLKTKERELIFGLAFCDLAKKAFAAHAASPIGRE